MKRAQVIFTLSTLLTAVLAGTLVYREIHFRIKQLMWETDAPNWARYAGSMQAHADYGNGVRRIYHPTLATSVNERRGFTGEYEGIAEVWSWLYYAEFHEAAKASAEAFANAYNGRMRGYIADPKSYEPYGLSATRPAE